MLAIMSSVPAERRNAQRYQRLGKHLGFECFSFPESDRNIMEFSYCRPASFYLVATTTFKLEAEVVKIAIWNRVASIKMEFARDTAIELEIAEYE